MEEKQLNEVCKDCGMIKLSISTYPTWVTHDKIEGLELVSGIVKTFWVNSGQRVYDEPPSHKIEKVLKLLEPDSNSNAVVKQDNTPLMPEDLTKALYEKWQNMSIAERLIMLQRTDSKYIKERKGRGGKVRYVDGHYMTMAANMAFGFLWSSHIDNWIRTETEIICIGYIEVCFNDKTVKKHAVGQKDIAFHQNSNEAVCLGDDYKGAETDMIKKALSYFGIAKDVYSGEV